MQYVFLNLFSAKLGANNTSQIHQSCAADTDVLEAIRNECEEGLEV